MLLTNRHKTGSEKAERRRDEETEKMKKGQGQRKTF